MLPIPFQNLIWKNKNKISKKFIACPNLNQNSKLSTWVVLIYLHKKYHFIFSYGSGENTTHLQSFNHAKWLFMHSFAQCPKTCDKCGGHKVGELKVDIILIDEHRL